MAGQDPSQLHDTLERYLAERGPLKAGIKQNTHVVRAWQRSSLAAIRSADMVAWRDAKLKRAGPWPLFHQFNLLSNLYDVAASDGAWTV